MIETVIAAVGVTTGVISILSTYSKVQRLLSHFETRDLELREQINQIQLKLDHQSEKTELLFNGLRERIEHVNVRLSTSLKQSSGTVSDIEAYLVKNTSYEHRSR